MNITTTPFSDDDLVAQGGDATGVQEAEAATVAEFVHTTTFAELGLGEDTVTAPRLPIFRMTQPNGKCTLIQDIASGYLFLGDPKTQFYQGSVSKNSFGNYCRFLEEMNISRHPQIQHRDQIGTYAAIFKDPKDRQDIPFFSMRFGTENGIEIMCDPYLPEQILSVRTYTNGYPAKLELILCARIAQHILQLVQSNPEADLFLWNDVPTQLRYLGQIELMAIYQSQTNNQCISFGFEGLGPNGERVVNWVNLKQIEAQAIAEIMGEDSSTAVN